MLSHTICNKPSNLSSFPLLFSLFLNLAYLKRLCHGSPVHFVEFCQLLAAIAMELNVSKESTCDRMTKSEIRDK